MSLVATQPETITGFLSRLAEDEDLFAAYFSDKSSGVIDSGLSTDDQRLLATGDYQHIRAVVREQEDDDTDACIVWPPM